MIYTQSLYNLFDITVHLSSFPFKTTLCRMLGLIGLVAFAEIILQVLSVSGNADKTKNNRRIFARSYERAY